jgi:Ca2+-binding RTX toxin-like protein
MLIDLTDPAAAAAAQRSGDFVLGTGTPEADILLGAPDERNALSGLGGHDLILGGAAGDELHGEGVVFPAVYPPPPITDDLRGRDTVEGRGGGDTIAGDWGDDLLDGGRGDDLLDGGEDNDDLDGGDGSDSLHGDAGWDRLHGGAGQDALHGGADDDVLDGGAGADTLDGGDGADMASYADADGAVAVDLAAGRARGAAGADVLVGIERVLGSAHPDRLRGDGGANALTGLAGDDLLAGRAGADTLHGGDGEDVLAGGAGDDSLWGGPGTDLLIGGAGADAFVFGSRGDGAAEPGTDVVVDFRPGGDVLNLAPLNHYSQSSDMLMDAAFVFRGQGALVNYPEDGDASAMPGQVRFEFRGDTTVVQLDVADEPVVVAEGPDGLSPSPGDRSQTIVARADGAVDAEIVLPGRHDLTAADFVL